MRYAPDFTDVLISIDQLWESSAADVRFPLFLFSFGVELPRPFLPLYLSQLYEPIPWLSREAAIALPMSAWVIAVLLATPVAIRIWDRYGVRAAFLAGIVPTAIGFAGTGLASGMLDVLVWRMVTAAGFGMVMAVGMVYTARYASVGRRARSLGVFFVATVAGSVCAAAIGGILADRLGYRLPFLFGVMLIVAAGLITLTLPAADRAEAAARRAAQQSGSALRALADPAFLFFMLMAAAPARLVLTGCFFYLVPLYLSGLGFSDAATGRVMMVFFIVTLVLIPVTGQVADRYDATRGLLIAGSAVSALGAVLLATAAGAEPAIRPWLVVLAAIGLGAGQCVARAPLVAYLPVGFRALADREGMESLVVAYRAAERIGSFIGPFAAGFAATLVGYDGAMRMFGLVLLAITVGLALFLLLHRPATDPVVVQTR